MRRLKREQGEVVIPQGCYCYDENGVCPYLSDRKDKPPQMNSYCWFLEIGDWEEKGSGLLWDQCKECGINDEIDGD